MIRSSIKCLASFSLLLALLLYPLEGHTEAVKYQYTMNNKTTINHWFADQGIQTQVNKGSGITHNVIYNLEENAMYTFKTGSGNNSPEAQKLSKAGIKKLTRQIRRQFEKMNKQLKRLPPEQREKVKQQMNMGGKNPDDVKEKLNVTFQETEQVTWKGMEARKGVVKVGQGTDMASQTEVILLNKPPVSLSEGQKAAAEGLQTLFKDMMTLLESSPMLNGSSLGAGFNAGSMGNQQFLGDKQLRLAESKGNNRSLTLTEWGRDAVPFPEFRPPSGYEVSSIEESMRQQR